MSLKYMILGVLMERPYHGYELKSRAFLKVAGEFGVNDGQLYPLLKKMEAEALISKKVEVQSGAPNRHVYSITADGRQEFFNWLNSGEGEEQAFRYEFFRRDPFFLRCTYIRYLPRDAALLKLDGKEREIHEHIEDLRAASHDMTERKVDPFRIKILEYGIISLQARLDWLKSFRDLAAADESGWDIGGENREAHAGGLD